MLRNMNVRRFNDALCERGMATTTNVKVAAVEQLPTSAVLLHLRSMQTNAAGWLAETFNRPVLHG